MSTVWTGYGRPAYDALRAAVAQHKRADPLAPVTVLVPGNLAGVHVRRALAHGFGGHPGVAGLDVLTADRLADRIAAPALAGSGRRPITEPVLAAAWRRVLAGDPGVFGPVAAHPSTVRALATAHRELREVNDAGLDALRAGGPVATDLVRLHRRVVGLLHHDWYDIVDLRRLAGSTQSTLHSQAELVVHFLPQDVPASAEALLEAIAHKTVIAGVEREGAPTSILHASDADDEVRCVVRRLATTLRRVPAHRIAVLYGSARPYARLLADHLRAAGIRWNGTGVQPTAERTLARMLPEVLATQHTGWQRADVMRLLADAPAVTSTATWERISRAAGVVGGDDWETRLKAYAGERDADAADELRVFVGDLRERLREGAGLTNWPALADWGRATQAALVGELDERHVPEDQIRANAAVVRILEAMAGLESVEPSADLGLLGLTLDLELAGDLPRHGRMGDGVLVGPLSDAIGLDADAVFLLGLSEDLVPGRPGTDALLPDEVRELAGGQLPLKRERIERRRRHLWAAFAAAPEVTASYARGDLRRSTTRLPSRWLRTRGAGESASFAESLTRTDDLASEQEWRIRAAAAHTLTDDHVVDLGVHLREQRHSDLLTRFDGDLSAHQTPDPTDGTILSPTALEAWSRCPHSYFVEKLLRVRPIETPEEQLTISPIERGNLYHEALDRFFAEQDAAGAVPGGATAWSPEQRRSLRRIALAVADDLAVRGATGHRLLWAQELAGVLSRLDQYLDADEEMRAATGRKQIRSELTFGLHGEPPVPITLPDGRTLLLRGSADRVDTGPGGLVVVDFKSGGRTAFAGLGADDPTLSGAKLQLPVYGYAARQALGSLQDVSAEYWFVHRDAGQRIGLPLTPAVEAAFLAAVTVIADGMAGGLFPHRPPVDDGRSGWVPCGYCDPDALGADEHRERWERKRTDPRLAGYVALIGGDGVSLGDEAARRMIAGSLGETLFVEAGAGSGKTTALVRRVVALVVDDGVPLSRIAAVTFTEKAGAELRDRLRSALPDDSAAVDELDTAAIGTLHSFALRILNEHPIEAGLPPLLEIQDEVASGVQGDARWTALRSALLDDATLTDTLLLAMAAGVRLDDLKSMAVTFNANWDLLESRVLAVPAPDLPAIDVAALAADARRLADHAAHCTDAGDKLVANLGLLAAWATTLENAPDDAARITALGSAVSTRWHTGRKGSWPSVDLDVLRANCRAVGEAAAALRDTILDATLRRLAQHIARAVLDQAAVRRADGRLEFHDQLVLARELLRGPVHGAAVRSRLQQRYRKLLLDEFQDTDPIQIELAVRIAGGAAATQEDWADVVVPAGSLFVVGDPKQSIYRFRRADIATYLRAQEKLGREVVLDTNFRTTAPVLAWVNEVFAQLIVAAPGSQPAYRALRAHREAAPVGPAVLALGAAAHLDAPNALTLREREAADVVAAVRTALHEKWQVDDGAGGWRDLRLGDVAVLVPSRTSLPQLENALDAAGLGYHPGATSLVYRSREIRDLLTAARAADDPSDQLALVSALRSPLFGCGDDDLWTWVSAHGRLHLFGTSDVPVSHPVAVALGYLRRLHRDRTWLAPSEVLTRLIDDRRLFEQAVSFPRSRDVWRRLRYVVDQARAWSESEHGGLRGYLAWAARQGSDTGRVAEAALPETDTDSLKIMTIHSAKGLEFPMVIVSGLTTRVAHPAQGVHVLWPRDGGYALKLGSRAQTADYDAARPVDEQMGRHEKLRLLYVAATRARDHLVVSLHRKGSGESTGAELLAGVAPAVPSLGLDDFDLERPPVAAVTAPPSLGKWSAAMAATRAAAARPSAVSASGLEGTLPSAADPGLAKGPRDLELAPWHKGRYGTAIGRAVHGVLQQVDLATGAGLADAVAAQALAEGVTPLADLVSQLASSALTSPLVRRAAASRHWRESYVATVVGDRVLEGIVDLLYRDDDGLVIVDYKTDAVPLSALSSRVDFYRPQLAAYAAALEAATGEQIARCVLLFLSPTGAEAWEVPELGAAVTAVRAAVVA